MDTVASVPEDGEKIIEIQLERLRTFKNHPFKVRMDQEMIRLSASVEKYGIINPLIVRPIPDGVYEIISGHRRKAAAEKFGYRKVPVIIGVMSDDDAVVVMEYSKKTSNCKLLLLDGYCTRVCLKNNF